ncbi:MAG: toll/interleukin-1 receptor domain-containing protein [Myxococcales bacterium]|nr:toll/interleukin-1 receptor domain-containing protein [Myxococcales bacterium]
MAHTYFLAHASKDKPLIRELYDALVAAGVGVFLDEVDVLPGDEWDQVIPQAHQRCRATLVVVSPNYDQAFYLRDEVHTAIRWSRQSGSEHWVIPMLHGPVADPPYGLTITQGLDLAALGMEALVGKLVALAERLEGSPMTPLAAPTPPRVRSVSAGLQPGQVRQALYEALCALLTGSATYFDEILMFTVPAARDRIPGAESAPAARAMALVQWAGLQGDDTLDEVWAAVKAKAPTTLP